MVANVAFTGNNDTKIERDVGLGEKESDVCQRRLRRRIGGCMLTWVMYDIKKDRTRNKVAKLCEEAGIYRVQYSVFLGDLNNAQRKELIAGFM